MSMENFLTAAGIVGDCVCLGMLITLFVMKRGKKKNDQKKK